MEHQVMQLLQAHPHLANRFPAKEPFDLQFPFGGVEHIDDYRKHVEESPLYIPFARQTISVGEIEGLLLQNYQERSALLKKVMRHTEDA